MKRQAVKFIVVGGLNTIVGYALFAVFLMLGFHYTLAAFFATILGLLFNFFTIGRLVFENNENNLIFRFIGVYALVYSFNITGLWIGVGIGLTAYLSGIFLILPLALLSFFLNKYFVFNTLLKRV